MRKERIYSKLEDGFKEIKLGKIGITKMCINNGVLGIPIDICWNWDATVSINGCFEYGGCKSKITITPKHEFLCNNNTLYRAPAWQFTVNNSKQFAQLTIDSVNTRIANKVIGEKLVCEFTYIIKNKSQYVYIKVINTELHPDTDASKVVRDFLKQGIRKPILKSTDHAILWSRPSEWKTIDTINECKDIYHCIYMWYGSSINDNSKYLYIGIVGDVRGKKKLEGGRSKRTLATRINEEIKSFGQKGIKIEKYRYDVLLDFPDDTDPSEILKTAEMKMITAMSSVIPCPKAQAGIQPLLPSCDIVLINDMTSYRFVK